MRRLVFVFSALLTGAAVRAHAQPSGVLAGTVHTSEGTPVPNLVLVVRGPDAARTVVTGPEGRYRVTGLTPGHYRLVTVFRYLHRPLFPVIEGALAPGGWLVYETYREGQERFGRPIRARFLLGPGELSSAFPGLSVVRYEEPEPDGGPVTARLLAFKPGDPA